MIDIVEERRKAKQVVESDNFDYLIMFVICLDAIALGMLTIGLYDIEFFKTMFLIDRMCMAIFIVEMLIKMYAYGPRFFKSGWNVFDFSVIAISSLPGTDYLVILRTFRLFRLLKYVSKFSKLKNLVNIMLLIIPNMLAMCAILTVFVYVFGVMGVVLFGEDVSAFSNLGSSMFSMVQAFTLDGWASTIVRPVMRIYPYAWIFFMGFVVLSFWLIISFVLSVLTMLVKKDFRVKSRL